MPALTIRGCFFGLTVLTSAFMLAQEPYEARAARLQPEDIPPLIEKAQAGDLSSEVLLWLAYSHGYGVPKDIQKGLPWLRKSAEQGSTEGEFVLSTLYEFGRGVAVDQTESFKWALKAAQSGHMIAQHNVGSDYLHGAGVEENLGQARYWYGRAAEQGFAHSEWMLGRIYAEGLGVAPNREEALKWLDKSLAQEHVPTMIYLASMYTDANGLPSQPQLVFDLQQAAAQRGSHYSEFELGRFYRAGYLGAPDYVQAMSWFNRAAAAGYGPADYYLGAMYEAGQGVLADLARARSHYERAADVGVSDAIEKMGELYRDGQGGPSDLVMAYMWFTIGAKMGVSETENALESLKPRCTPAQRVMAEARANTWAVAHPEAMKQRPGHFQYQEWTHVERGPLPARGPSTQQERGYAILLTRNLENDPLSLDASAARAWLEKWWDEVPDFLVRPCNLIDPPNHEPYEYSQQLYQRITYSEGAFILENPSKSKDWDSSFLAGINGALRAYQSILQKKPLAKSSFLDDLVQQRDSGRLPVTVQALVKERCNKRSD